MHYLRKITQVYIVTTPVRIPDGKVFLKWAKKLFIRSTGVIMTEYLASSMAYLRIIIYLNYKRQAYGFIELNYTKGTCLLVLYLL